MTEKEDTIATHVPDFKEYDFLDFGCSKGASLRFGAKKFKGKRGIGFDIDPRKVEIANQLLQNQRKYYGKHKAVIRDVTKLNVTNETAHKFRFTTCIHFLEQLQGINDTKQALFAAVKLSSKFVYIAQPNFDADVNLFKKGFKTHYSDWTSHTNHITSNVFFNILFGYYKIGYIEDFMIFYSKPIKDSSDPVIHPLNSPKNQQEFDENAHPAKVENVKFKNIYKEINVIITIKGYKKIDNIYDMIRGEKQIIYDSRNGIYEGTAENFAKKTVKDKGIFGKMNEFLNSEL